MSKILLTNATVVLPDEVRNGLSVLIEDGIIASLDPATTAGAATIDLAGLLLLPGLVDLHCDALEKEVEPRAKVYFPLDLACAEADKRNAAAGITTAFHAISFSDNENGVRNNAMAADIVREIHRWQQHALVENLVHARYEITDEGAVPFIETLLHEGLVHLLSFMDHSPGQGQYRDLAAFKSYLADNYRMSDVEMEAHLDQKLASARTAMDRVGRLATAARRGGISIASHDDDTVEKVRIAAGLGATISEFPINLVAARAAKVCGLFTLFGAPNIVRGKSQSGAVRALDAVLAGAADAICGDYSPAAMLPALLKLPSQAGIGPHEAVALGTRNPARAAGLADRGEIVPGKRADLVAVSTQQGSPQCRQVWCNGSQVFLAHPRGGR